MPAPEFKPGLISRFNLRVQEVEPGLYRVRCVEYLEDGRARCTQTGDGVPLQSIYAYMSALVLDSAAVTGMTDPLPAEALRVMWPGDAVSIEEVEPF